MSDFSGMEDLLQDFLVEATDLLSGVDNKLVDLEQNPHDLGLLNEIFRGFHTIKGGAGFLNAAELVTLCHLTESLFDKLRTGEMAISGRLMDVILDATGAVRDMFGNLEGGVQPAPANPALIAQLKAALAGELVTEAAPTAVAAAPAAAAAAVPASGPDWDNLFNAVTGAAAPPAAATDAPPPGMHHDTKAATTRRRATTPSASTPRASTRCSTSRARSA